MAFLHVISQGEECQKVHFRIEDKLNCAFHPLQQSHVERLSGEILNSVAWDALWKSRVAA
jgi:hypothetical protein